MVEKIPFVYEAIKKQFEEFESTSNRIKFELQYDSDFKNAFHNIKKDYHYHFFFINLFSYNDQSRDVREIKANAYGEKLAHWIRNKLPNSKLGIMTEITSKPKLFELQTKLHPEVFIIKQDTWLVDLKKMILDIANGKKHYSPLLQEIFVSRYSNKFRLDELDLLILHYLSNGYPTNQLPDHIPLSLSGIEKRKRKLSKSFFLGNSKSLNIVRAAQRLGII